MQPPSRPALWVQPGDKVMIAKEVAVVTFVGATFARLMTRKRTYTRPLSRLKIIERRAA